MSKIKLTNTLSGKKEVFEPLVKGAVSYYSCGPTVYNYVHIGNLRTYIFADIIKRVLQFNGLDVHHVMNITDVGHLTSDADEGEDKMLLGAAREKKTVWELAEFYTACFRDNMRDLHLLEPSIWCKATDHIQDQIALIEKLFEKGFAYAAGGNVYFDTAKLTDYGKLAGDGQRESAVARVDMDTNKRNVSDFALWFTKSKFGEQDMRWDSPWGVGYPGWHIECSAMSARYLGQPFDIHSGGIDHIPVHHTNEIAQSEAAMGVPLARYWLHGEFLVLPQKRMGKSEGNLITLQMLKERGYDPLAYRYFTYNAHYRQQLTFTWEALDAAADGYRNLCDTITRIQQKTDDKPSIPSETCVAWCAAFRNDFRGAVNDDLNIPRALAKLHEFLGTVHRHEPNLSGRDYAAILGAILETDSVLGLDLEHCNKSANLPSTVTTLIEKRSRARQEGRWNDADTIRSKIESLGYRVEDSGSDSTAFKL